MITYLSAQQPPPSAFPLKQHPSGERPATRRRRIIVVDDERLIADTVAQILNIHGYDAFAAYGPMEALTLAQDFHPDLLLSDVVMPGMNGIDLATTLKQSQPHLKVLLLSGQAGTLNLMRQSSLEFKLEAKPIHPRKLLTTLETLLRED